MTPARARLTLFAITALFIATAGNALFLQDQTALLKRRVTPSTNVSLPQFPEGVSPSPDRKPTPGTSAPKVAAVQPYDPRLAVALERELGKRGYTEQLQAPANGLRLAALAYQFDAGLPLTGEPSDALLKQILFDLNRTQRGNLTLRAEASVALVAAVQKTLLELGFFSGPLSSRMDDATTNAVKAFERHRGLPAAGRLTEATLLELINYSGQPLIIQPN